MKIKKIDFLFLVGNHTTLIMDDLDMISTSLFAYTEPEIQNLPPLQLHTFHQGSFSRRILPSRTEHQYLRRNRDPIRQRREVQVSNPHPIPHIQQLFKGCVKPFHETFPSLLSNIQNIPIAILITFSMCNSSFTGRNLFMHKKRVDAYTFKQFCKPFKWINNPTSSKGLMDDLNELYYEWIKKEQFVRTHMRSLVRHWMYKRYSKRILNETDPCTMAEPIQSIQVFDTKSRGFYKFEASSLLKLIESELSYSEWMIPLPKQAKNPFTGLSFTEGQLLTILEGLRKYGKSSWMLEAYRKSGWNLTTFKEDFRVPLRLYALHHMVKNPSSTETVELIEEFIEDQYEIHDISARATLNILRWAVKNEMDESYMQSWLQLFQKFYKLKIRYGYTSLSKEMDEIHTESFKLFRNRQKIAEIGERRLYQLRKTYPSPVATIENSSPTVHHTMITANTSSSTGVTGMTSQTEVQFILNPETLNDSTATSQEILDIILSLISATYDPPEITGDDAESDDEINHN